MERALEGIRVIDAASFIAGPAAATVMADFGAEVIKVEPPELGDTYRRMRAAPGNPPCDHDYAWHLDNRNKRSLALDLRSERGQAVLLRLVERADVFVTNAPLPARERLGIAYPRLRACNPRLVYASLTAYGETGPEAANPGFDSTALWARSSLMDMVRPAPDAPPARSLPGMGDHPSAVSLYAAIATALFRRERTGAGAYVSTSLLANGIWWNGVQIQAMLTGAEYRRRPAREAAASAVHNLYQARDGRWFHLVLIPEEKRWGPLLELLERPELADDPRFATSAARHRHSAALVAALDAAFAARDWAHWQAAFDARGISYGTVGTLRDIAGDRQAHASGALVPADPRSGAAHTVASPLWVHDAPKVAPRAAPALGEHTEEILREAGYDADAVAALRAARVIG